MSKKGTNTLQPSQHQFVISSPDHNDVAFRIQTFTVPGFSFNAQEIEHMGIKYKIPGDVITYDPVTLTILLDSELSVLETLFNHVHGIRNVENNALDPEYRFTGSIKLYDGLNYPTVTFTLHDCFITGVTSFDMSSVISDNEILTTTATVEFTWLEFKRET